ncbi:MAG: hypothetical protein ACR2HY_01640 [Acidimicrobiales bacterium]
MTAENHCLRLRRPGRGPNPALLRCGGDPCPTAGRQQGSALLLFPAAVLVVIVLAAITVDSAIAFLGQREVANAVVSAANDAAGEGVGNRAFYRGGRVDLDPGAVRQVAVGRVTAALDAARFHGLSVDVVVATAPAGCPPRVRVRATARVSVLFAAAIPAAPHERQVSASATGAPRLAPAGC